MLVHVAGSGMLHILNSGQGAGSNNEQGNLENWRSKSQVRFAAFARPGHLSIGSRAPLLLRPPDLARQKENFARLLIRLKTGQSEGPRTPNRTIRDDRGLDVH